MDIGPKLKTLIRHFGIRNVDIARKLDVTGGAVANWFSSSRIDKENLAKVASILWTTTEEILMLDADEIIERVAERKAKRQHLPSIPGPTRQDMQRRVYTPEALNIAWAYDNLPNADAKLKVDRFVADLEIGPMAAIPKSARAIARADAGRRSTPRPSPVAAPTLKRRPKTRS